MSLSLGILCPLRGGEGGSGQALREPPPPPCAARAERTHTHTQIQEVKRKTIQCEEESWQPKKRAGESQGVRQKVPQK